MASAKEAQVSQTKLQLPKNYEAILEDEDLQIDKSSPEKLYEQLYSGVFSDQKEKKFWVDKLTKEFFAVLFARSLSYPKGKWIFRPIPIACPGLEEFKLQESHRFGIEEAILQESKSFEVQGKCYRRNPRTSYEVSFIIRMEEGSYGWEDPVNLKLVHPNGKVEIRQQYLNEKHKLMKILVGVTEGGGEIKFSMHESTQRMKKGLVVLAAVIIRSLP